jgi:glycosyltransferase involved in cell wall biosynthesis
MPIPLLVLSDSVTSTSGLGRITRDLATRIHETMQDTFRVATIGYGGTGSCKLGFQQYFIHEINQWVVKELPAAWKDFAGDEHGILLVIWDASRLLWLSQPEQYCQIPALREFLMSKPFDLWTYSAIDAEGPNGKLSAALKIVLEGFDRVLTYSEWSARIVERTLGNNIKIDSLPHGIDTSVFYPRMRDKARRKFGEIVLGQEFAVEDGKFLIGIVATNQPRKDWATGIKAVAELAKTEDVLLWIHTDTMERANGWSISTLLHDYGINTRTIITQGNLSDEQMAWAYSACDVTFGIGLGEGFGFPIYESLACGTPCIHGSYGGGAEWLPDEFKIEPRAYRAEGQFASLRPVYDSSQWVEAALRLRCKTAMLPPELAWSNLWPRWSKWLKDGAK